MSKARFYRDVPHRPVTLQQQLSRALDARRFGTNEGIRLFAACGGYPAQRLLEILTLFKKTG
jgi:hypothetical protein